MKNQSLLVQNEYERKINYDLPYGPLTTWKAKSRKSHFWEKLARMTRRQTGNQACRQTDRQAGRQAGWQTSNTETSKKKDQKQTDRETDRQTERQTDRQTETKTDRDRLTDKHTYQHNARQIKTLGPLNEQYFKHTRHIFINSDEWP